MKMPDVLDQTQHPQRTGVAQLMDVLRQGEANAALTSTQWAELFNRTNPHREHVSFEAPLAAAHTLAEWTSALHAERVQDFSSGWTVQLQPGVITQMKVMVTNIATIGRTVPAVDVARKPDTDERGRLLDGLLDWALNHDPEELEQAREEAWR